MKLALKWHGFGRPEPRPISIVDRRAVDLAPLNPADPKDALRLLAYLRPDQPKRLTLTRGAISVASTQPDAGDAAPWLAQHLAKAQAGMLHAIYSIIAAQYFPEATQAAITDHLGKAGLSATPDTPILHLVLKADNRTPDAGMTATLCDSDEPKQMHLGRADFHGRWIEWSPKAPDMLFYPLVA